MKIITGVGENDHITANDFRKLFAGIFGPGNYILETGDKFATELVSNNELHIGTGVMCCEGHLSAEIEGATINITNGTQGMRRIDYVVRRYTKDESTKVEKDEWVYLMGTPDVTTPGVPECIEGNILAGDLIVDCPVIKLTLNGLNIEAVECLLPVVEGVGGSVNILKKFSNQVVSFTDKITLESSAYFNLKGSRLTYNKLTGEVVINLCGISKQSFSAGESFLIGYLDSKFLPTDMNIAVAMSASQESSGGAAGIIYNKTHSDATKIRGTAIRAIGSGYYIYASAHYFIEPGLV